MKTKFFLTIVSGFFSFCIGAQGWEWGEVILDAAGENVCTDPSGKMYLTGVYYDTTSIGPFILNNAGNGDFFLAKYDENGNVLWVETAGDTGDEEGVGINSDIFSNIYVIGDFSSHTIAFDNITLINDSSGNTQFESTFVVKYDSGGNALWAKKFRSVAGNISNDSFGNVYFTANDSIYKYDTDGNEIWRKKVSGYKPGLSTDAIGNTYITGSGGSAFDTITLPPSPNFIGRFNPSGSAVWAKGISDGIAHSASADAFGNVYFSGYFSDTIDFDTITLVNPYNSNRLYLAKYDSSGNVQWARQSSDSGQTKGLSVSADALGYVYVSGVLGGLVKFDTLTLSVSGEIFIAKYDSSGNAVLAKASNGFKGGQVFAVWADGFGNAYVTGWTNSDTCDFGNDTLFGKGLFIAKINSYPLGIEEKIFFSGNNLGVYPNPANEEFQLSLTGNLHSGKKLTIFLSDITGRKIKEIPFNQNSIKIKITDIDNGIYYLSLYNSNNLVAVQKLAVAK